jgi:hypothetical protein
MSSISDDRLALLAMGKERTDANEGYHMARELQAARLALRHQSSEGVAAVLAKIDPSTIDLQRHGIGAHQTGCSCGECCISAVSAAVAKLSAGAL